MEIGAFLLLNGTLSTPHRYITTTADGAVIKRMYDNKLYSLNPRYPEDPQYPYGEKGENDRVQVLRKVLGTVSADEIPDAEDAAILKDLKSEELYEFEREDGIPL